MRSPTSYSRKKATPIVSCGIGRVTLTMGGIVLQNPSQISSYPPIHPSTPFVYIHLVARTIRSGATKKNVSKGFFFIYLFLFFFESIRVV
jgi:hypothetical protein